LNVGWAAKFPASNPSTGAIVADTQFDPRKEKGRAATMRTRDAEAYIRKLQGFISRKTQFLAGAAGPLPVKAWNKFNQGQHALQEKRAIDLSPFANERLPGPPSATETVGQRQEKIRTKHPTALNQVFTPPVLKPFNVKDLDSLTKLTKANAKRMTKKWAKAEHERAQNELKQIVAVFRDAGISNDVQGLSYGQFDMLWNLTAFADKASLAYHSIQSKYAADQEIPPRRSRHPTVTG